MEQNDTTRALPLTQSQRWIVAGQRMLPESPMNNMAFAISVGQVDGDLFTDAVELMIAASESMALTLVTRGHEARLTFLSNPAPVVDRVANVRTDEEARAWCTDRCRQTIFQPGERLYDTAVLELPNGDIVWYFNQHHLITDGWGKSLQVSYALKTYGELAAGVAPSQANFAPFSEYLQDRDGKGGNTDYWEERVEKLADPPNIFGERNPNRESAAVRTTVSLGAARTQRLEAILSEPDVRNWSADLAKYTVFLTVLYVYLYRISGQRALTIGSPAHNRVSKSDKLTPGLFIELFPQSVTFDRGESFTSLLQKVKAETMDFLRYAKPGGSTRASTSSFNVLLNYINQSFVAGSEGADRVGVEWVHSGHTEPGYHLSLQVYDFVGGGELQLSFDVNTAVVDPVFHPEIPNQFLAVFDEFLADRTRAADGLPDLDSWVNYPGLPPLVDYPSDKTVVDLFRESAATHADRVAIAYEGRSMTYSELNGRSDQLAHYLLDSGVQPEELIGICLDRSLEMSIGLLGILKAGGAYVPIDPEYPDERILKILDRASIGMLLTTSHHAERLRSLCGAAVLSLDGDLSSITLHPASAPAYRPTPEQLMYVIYTSGSTGEPKGVMNQHDGLVNRLLWGSETFPLEPDRDVVLQKTTFCFDISVYELFWPLLVGARLEFARPGGHREDRYLKRIIREKKITTLHFVPSMLEVFLDRPAELPSLKRVFCSGEALTRAQVATFQAAYPDVELHNLYGPTEAAIEVTHWPVPRVSVARVPIGKPIANTPIFILDNGGRPCPVGVPGELYLGGVQVARGYHGRPGLTAERFVHRPVFAGEAPRRLYRTGDLCRFLPDGNIDYLGRIDSQVKLRGFRIELGEIEHALQAQAEVARTRVLANGEGQSAYLTAYVVASEGFSTDRAKERLAKMLPSYMVPNYFVKLDALPLNASGKVDVNALRVLGEYGATARESVAPQTPFEEMILEAWQDALGVEELGVTTSFHDLGGHSLSALRVINRVNEAFELELSANTLFRFPTVRGLALHVEDVIRRLMAEMENE